jgi:hypothetical protein
VAANLGSVTNLHTAIFALVCVLMLFFYVAMLRPFLDVVVNEGRRTAELLSQLPTEVRSWCGGGLVVYLQPGAQNQRRRLYFPISLGGAG